jgi:CubicO group peptidase (beta-lactamase class C family)
MPDIITPESVGVDARRIGRISPWMNEYVDSGRLESCLTAVMRRGKLVYLDQAGPVDPETIFRIYSMTKPITAAAAMTFFEEARFQLDDPVSRFLPEFENIRVWNQSGSADDTVPADSPLQIWHLFSHTSGLIYGSRDDTVIGQAYQTNNVDFSNRNVETLAATVNRLASLPLKNQPGTRWEYGVSTDVLGRLIEVLAGKPLDQVFQERIFDPLGMTDAGFQVPEAQAGRMPDMHQLSKGERTLAEKGGAGSSWVKPVTLFSGGGGLASTVGDYLKFCEMIRCKGVFGDVRILGRHTVELMTLNWMPGGVDLASMGQPTFSETSYEGVGFGLGFSIVLDPAAAKGALSVGEAAWGGAASTAFWIDPVEEVSVVFMTQLLPSSSYPIRRELRSLVYQSLID